MMHLRTLKRLSKRAAPLLLQLGDTREQFRAGRRENYHGSTGFPRKQWERGRCHDRYEAYAGEIVLTTRAGRRLVMREPCYALKGTVMVGGMSGYETPEWDEETAWDALRHIVLWSCGDVDFERGDWVPDRQLSTVREIFAAARSLIDARGETR